jgi:hypothetical protein
MNRLSAIDAIGPAFTRVGAMLFNPFRLRTWLKMGFIGWLGGGLITASSGYNFRPPVFPAGVPHDQLPPEAADIARAIRSIHLADYIAGHINIIVTVIVVIAVLALIFQYLFCRFRFILFDSVVTGRPAVGRGWRNYASQANRYFGFWLVFRLVSWAAVFLIVGLPLWRAYKSGVFSGDNSLPALIAFIGSIALGAIVLGIVLAIVSTLAKDFVMPVLALDDFSLGDAFSAVWRVVASEPGAWVVYMIMKVICAVGSAIALTVSLVIALIPAIVVIGIPVGLVFVLGALAFKTLGVGVGIAICIVGALLAAAGFLCVFMVLIAPITVFFASYAFYFFGGRYPKLAALLWPQPTPPAPQSQMAGSR